jgi:circadian clock protein KaiC
MGNQRIVLERVSTGVPALDGVLEGGIPRYATVFIAGSPGTGKTVLCQQAVFANGREGVPALYLSTLTEPSVKMMRHAETFDFFEPKLLGKEIIYSDIGGALVSEGTAGLLNAIDALVKEHRPEFLVIDSFKVIREYLQDAALYRKFLSQLVLMLTAWEVTAFLVGEYSEEDIQIEPDFAIADGILYLYGTEEPTRQRRFMRVMKMRGTDFFSGQHVFEISSEGMRLYPRMDPRVIEEYQKPEGRIGSTIAGLTEMMEGGIECSTAAVIVGSSGSGKSLTALSFLISGAMAGKAGLFVSFEERPDQLVRNAEQLGWQVSSLIEQHLLDLLYVSPSELDIDKHAAVIRDRAEAIHAEAVVIDTISAIEASLTGNPKAHDYLWAISDYFKRKGVTVVMTYEAQNHSDWGLLGASKLSFIADTIVNLGLSYVDGYMVRTISVPKMRGTKHDDALRQWFIRKSDVHVGEVYPHGRSP